MIRTLPKPHPDYPKQLKKQRLPVRNRMTLALAMVCEGGVMLAADTRMSYGEGVMTTEAQKVTGFDSNGGMYVIVHSSEDAHAANSLIGEVRLGLQDTNPKTFSAFETTVRSVLQTSYQPIHDNRPIIRLLIGACVEQERDHGLYFCEPPNTVTRVYDNYKAIGDGWQVSDPIYEWFKDGAPWSPHACLCQISYMMYRAKKLLPGSIGGHTDVGFLKHWQTVPYWIERLDMADAEGRGTVFDGLVSQFASIVMLGSAGGAKALSTMADQIYQFNLHYGTLQFRCQFPDKTIRHLFYT